MLGEEAVNGQLVESLEQRVSSDIAAFVQDAVASLDGGGRFANLTIASVLALVVAGSILFVLVHFCAQVLLYGAEFVKAWQHRRLADVPTSS